MSKHFSNRLPSLISLFILLLCADALFGQSKIKSLDSAPGQVWFLKAETELAAANGHIHEQEYNTNNWVPAIVPGTAFSSFVAAGIEKDPNFGDNIYKVDRQKYDRNFWYRTIVDIPSPNRQQKVFIGFKGINRKADIFFNGKKLGSLDGFMHRGEFEVTELINGTGKNILAVLVYLPVKPLGNLASPTYISSAGWDWMPYVPGLNMGITDKVYVRMGGSLSIKDPWIQAKLPTNARADLSLAVTITNHSAVKQKGILKGTINPGNIEFSEPISIDGGESSEIRLDKKRFNQFIINEPRLWWPNGYGEPNLYTCNLKLEEDSGLSDEQTVKFGIKKYTYDTLGNVLHVSINGVKVFIKGGNWGMSEYLLRCRGEEYDTKVRLHKEMNFNMIRNWLGSTTDDEFYEACDRYGIMVWDDFWINANPNLPRDLNTFNTNVIEKIKRFRNHPAIAVWCADNESWPEPPLSGWLKENIATFDGGDRFYQPNSHAQNLTGSGPWASFDPRYYFTAYPTGLGGNKGWGLRTELGTAVFTNFESFKKFMPKSNWWPRNEMWNQHFFGELAFNAGPDNYEKSIATRYGEPSGIEDFCRKAQLLNIETNKAMYEGWLDHMWEDASGLMTWMSQPAYPSLVWQTFDYYYDLTGAFWGAKSACEPLHIQWNPVSDAIKLVNTTKTDKSGIVAEAMVYNMDGKLMKDYSHKVVVNSLANTATQAFKLDFKQEYVNLALNKPVFVSSTTLGEPGYLTDSREDSRWSSRSRDNEWFYVDLGEVREVSGVGLKWEDAYAKSFKIQVSNNAKEWNEVYSTTEGEPGSQKIYFTETNARYVRLQGIERATYWGYSLFNFEVYEQLSKSTELSDVHFLRLKLKDQSGQTLSENFYWRGKKRADFTALGKLPQVKLETTSQITRRDGRTFIKVKVGSPHAAKGVAFGIRVQAINSKTGEQILPAVMSDNYFSLMPGESRELIVEFQDHLLGNGKAEIIATPFNELTKPAEGQQTR